MADYLIALAVGPVQGFIAAARRTRDLWFGSEVLSEVSKAAAQALHKQGARLVFPAPQSPHDLQPRSALNVGNKLMAVIDHDTPQNVLEAAKKGASDRWKEIAESACGKLDAKAIRADLWKIQMDDVLELYGAWCPLEGGDSGYAAARARLERLLGSRKTTRDFSPAALAFDGMPGFGKPKSSLDAARETVLAERLASTTRRKLGLSSGEQLDCPGLVKRLGGDPEQFPPVTRIALESWLERVPDDALDEVRAAFEPLVGHQLVTRVRPDRFHRLPYDGAFLFPSRIEAESRGLEDDEKDALPSLNVLKALRDRLHKDFGEPTPYFAVLVADGDHMGAFIDASDNEAAHVAVTRALAGFAGQARDIVENHCGACVYAGGDDVLALLPIHRAVECARALRDAFAVVVQSLLAPGVEKLPTLSVGLGLGHVLTPFGRLLDLGRRAEKLAKEGLEDTEEKRNALAIIVGVRSGAEIAVRGRWDSGLDERLAEWMGYFHEDRLSDKTPYNLREAAGRVAWAEGQPNYKTIAAQEAGRVLAKKRGEAGTQELADEVKNSVTQAIERHGLNTITAELLVARWLAQKAKE